MSEQEGPPLQIQAQPSALQHIIFIFINDALISCKISTTLDQSLHCYGSPNRYYCTQYWELHKVTRAQPLVRILQNVRCQNPHLWAQSQHDLSLGSSYPLLTKETMKLLLPLNDFLDHHHNFKTYWKWAWRTFKISRTLLMKSTLHMYQYIDSTNTT